MKNRKAGLWVACLLVLAACDQEWTGAWADAVLDALPDVYDPGYDTVVADTGSVDTAVEEAEAPCTYPGGPHSFRAVGDIVPPMSWPAAVPGSEETSLAADLEDYFCDPEVHSVFVLVTNTT